MTRDPISVSTLEDALSWLIIHTNCESWIFDPEIELPQAALFACDMFWVSPNELRKKLRALWPVVPMRTRVQKRAAYLQQRRLAR